MKKGPDTATKATAHVPSPREVAVDLANRIRDYRLTIAALEEKLHVAEVAANLAEAPILRSDEGVLVWHVSPSELVNLDERPFEARSLRLHVRGLNYEHVGETVDGRWTYRHDS